MSVESRPNKVAAVVLAAGRSSRFGSNKLLHKVLGRTVLEWSLDPVLASGFWEVAVVIPQKSEMKKLIPAGVKAVVNENSKDGIGTSIAKGAGCFEKEADGILFLLGDQPLLRKRDIGMFLAAFSSNPRSIIACYSEGEIRNPILFPSGFFGELKRLKGDRGARDMARLHPERLVKIEIDIAHLVDIDTKNDILALEKGLEVKFHEDR